MSNVCRNYLQLLPYLTSAVHNEAFMSPNQFLFPATNSPGLATPLHHDQIQSQDLMAHVQTLVINGPDT